MITFSSQAGAACAVAGSSLSFLVFPTQTPEDTFCLLDHPKEELEAKVISWPGEYDFGGMILKAIGQQDGRQVSYSCELERVRIAFVGAPVMEWSDGDIQALGDIDVLVIAADDPKKVTALVEAVDPRIVILFPVEGGQIGAVAKACGSAAEAVTEFKVKPGSLPTETRQVVVLGE